MKRVDWIIAGLFILLAAALRLGVFSGLYGHDDWPYLFFIRSYLNGQYDELLHSPHGLRYGIWLPILGSFKLFGVAYWSAFLPGFIQGLATIPITFMATRKLGLPRWAGAFGAFVLVLNPIDWMVATTIRGDIEMSFYGGLLLLLLLHFRSASGKSRQLWGIAAGLLWGLSALTKEWGYVFAWGIAGMALLETVSKRRVPWSFGLILAGFVFVLAADVSLLRWLTGDWLARFHASITYYERVAAAGEYQGDLSTSYQYLPHLLLGLRTAFTTAAPFANSYPYLGPYMLTAIVALLIVLTRRNPAWPVACFILGVLLWIEFGSMSWSIYRPYHKEPRYLSLLSVPIAVLIATAAAQTAALRQRAWRIAAIGFLGITSVLVVRAVWLTHQTYIQGRDFLPALGAWLAAHPTARVWVPATVQNEMDLRFGYRFSDPVHKHAGAPGFGSLVDVCFVNDHQAGDFILVQGGWNHFADENPELDRRRMKLVTRLDGNRTSAEIYEFQPVRYATGSHYLSDDRPLRNSHTYARPKWDLTFDGAPIQINGVPYPKGIGTHATSELVFRLGPGYTHFCADLGLADKVECAAGSVVFVVYADGELRYRSPIVRQGSPTESIRIAITGTTELTLSVEDAGDGIACDHAVWANAYVTDGISEPTPLQ